MVSDAVEDHVVRLPARGEVLARVIDHAIRANGPHEVQIPCAADPGNVRTKRLGDLHREGPDATGSTVDQDSLPRPDPPLVAKTLQRRQTRKRH
jgi:hypothetical protein